MAGAGQCAVVLAAVGDDTAGGEALVVRSVELELGYLGLHAAARPCRRQPRLFAVLTIEVQALPKASQVLGRQFQGLLFY